MLSFVHLAGVSAGLTGSTLAWKPEVLLKEATVSSTSDASFMVNLVSGLCGSTGLDGTVVAGI